jgi:hypothetical protein
LKLKAEAGEQTQQEMRYKHKKWQWHSVSGADGGYDKN